VRGAASEATSPGVSGDEVSDSDESRGVVVAGISGGEEVEVSLKDSTEFSFFNDDSDDDGKGEVE